MQTKTSQNLPPPGKRAGLVYHFVYAIKRTSAEDDICGMFLLCSCYLRNVISSRIYNQFKRRILTLNRLERKVCLQSDKLWRMESSDTGTETVAKNIKINNRIYISEHSKTLYLSEFILKMFNFTFPFFSVNYQQHLRRYLTSPPPPNSLTPQKSVSFFIPSPCACNASQCQPFQSSVGLCKIHNFW